MFRAYETESPCLELTCNWDQKDDYDKGNGWGHVCIETPDVYKACDDLAKLGVNRHVCIETPDVYKACDDLAKLGVNITRKPGPMKHGTRVIAFCEDPDGYKVELNEPVKV